MQPLKISHKIKQKKNQINEIKQKKTRKLFLSTKNSQKHFMQNELNILVVLLLVNFCW